MGIMVADINNIRCNPKGNSEGNWQLQKLVPPRPTTEGIARASFHIGFMTNQMGLHKVLKD